MSHTLASIHHSETSTKVTAGYKLTSLLKVGDLVKIIKDSKEDGLRENIAEITKISSGWHTNIALHFDGEYLDEPVELPSDVYIKVY